MFKTTVNYDNRRYMLVNETKSITPIILSKKNFGLVLNGYEYRNVERDNEKCSEARIVAEILPGEVDFISSREGLDETPRTKEFIKKTRHNIRLLRSDLQYQAVLDLGVDNIVRDLTNKETGYIVTEMLIRVYNELKIGRFKNHKNAKEFYDFMKESEEYLKSITYSLYKSKFTGIKTENGKDGMELDRLGEFLSYTFHFGDFGVKTATEKREIAKYIARGLMAGKDGLIIIESSNGKMPKVIERHVRTISSVKVEEAKKNVANTPKKPKKSLLKYTIYNGGVVDKSNDYIKYKVTKPQSTRETIMIQDGEVVDFTLNGLKDNVVMVRTKSFYKIQDKIHKMILDGKTVVVIDYRTMGDVVAMYDKLVECGKNVELYNDDANPSPMLEKKCSEKPLPKFEKVEEDVFNIEVTNKELCVLSVLSELVELNRKEFELLANIVGIECEWWYMPPLNTRQCRELIEREELKDEVKRIKPYVDEYIKLKGFGFNACPLKPLMDKGIDIKDITKFLEKIVK